MSIIISTKLTLDQYHKFKNDIKGILKTDQAFNPFESNTAEIPYELHYHGLGKINDQLSKLSSEINVLSKMKKDGVDIKVHDKFRVDELNKIFFRLICNLNDVSKVLDDLEQDED